MLRLSGIDHQDTLHWSRKKASVVPMIPGVLKKWKSLVEEKQFFKMLGSSFTSKSNSLILLLKIPPKN